MTTNTNAPEKDKQTSILEPKKTTTDDGKTFDKDTVFVCVQDTWQNMTRYRRGDVITGRTCPPWFEAKPGGDGKKK